jgi:hypothetical protein
MKINLNATKKTFTFFCTITKVKVNWGKFVTIWAFEQKNYANGVKRRA